MKQLAAALLILGCVGCAYKPCADKIVTVKVGWFGPGVGYHPCAPSNCCDTGGDPDILCGCAKRCPCWGHHQHLK